MLLNGDAMTSSRRLILVPLTLMATSLLHAQPVPRTDVLASPVLTQGSPTVPPDKHGSPNQEDSTANAEKSRSKADDDKPLRSDYIHHPVLWASPDNVSGRDLFYGQGGERHQPKPPFKFISEDMSGTNPKFDARDADGKKWRVKLGEESRPEVVASRLLWSVGYFVNDDYVLAEAEVQSLKMHRKSGNMKGDHITDARFARKPGGQDKIGIWEWKDNPFTGSREFNGLRVMMAVMNNWDLKDSNNSVYRDDKSDRQIFLVNDVGATFGTNGLSWTRAHSKGNIETFKGSKFITRMTDTEVDFATPAAPTAYLAKMAGLSVVPFAKRASLDWIGKNIPRDDARWIASLLAQLTHRQLVDAFRAGGFPPDAIAIYVTLIENRIAELSAL